MQQTNQNKVRKSLFSRKYNLQFKIWISENQKLKRWENYPCDQNRHYTIYLKSVRLLVTANTFNYVEQQGKDYVESQDFIIGEVRKFDEKLLENDDDRSSQSFEGFGDFQEFDDFSPPVSFNLEYIGNVFKQITSRLQITEAKIDIKYGDGRVITTSKKVSHVISLKNETNQFPLPSNYYIHNQLLVNQLIVENSIDIAKNILHKITSNDCLLFHGLQMSLVIKYIRKLMINSPIKLGLVIKNQQVFSQLINNVEKQFVIESLILSNALVFMSIQVMNKIIDLIQSVGISVQIQYQNFGKYILTVCDRPILGLVIQQKYQFSIETIELCSIHIESMIKKRIENIRCTEQNSKSSRVICLSFGCFESLNIIEENKQLLNKLVESHLIYVLTPLRLSEHSQLINLFPKIMFISFTYLQMQYMKEHKQIESIFCFGTEFLKNIQLMVYQYPLCNLKIINNQIIITNTDTSVYGINGFDCLTQQLNIVINKTNRSRQVKQNKSLTLTKLNASMLMIRQTFQTQVFLSKLIFQTIECQIDYIVLFVFNRFQTFRFLEQLKSLVTWRYYNTSVLAYIFGYAKNRHCYNMHKQEFTEILEHLQKCIDKPSKSSNKLKHFSIKYLN